MTTPKPGVAQFESLSEEDREKLRRAFSKHQVELQRFSVRALLAALISLAVLTPVTLLGFLVTKDPKLAVLTFALGINTGAFFVMWLRQRQGQSSLQSPS